MNINIHAKKFLSKETECLKIAKAFHVLLSIRRQNNLISPTLRRYLTSYHHCQTNTSTSSKREMLRNVSRYRQLFSLIDWIVLACARSVINYTRTITALSDSVSTGAIFPSYMTCTDTLVEVSDWNYRLVDQFFTSTSNVMALSWFLCFNNTQAKSNSTLFFFFIL